MPDFELAGLDLAVIGLYAVGIVAIGFWVGRGTKNSDDYFLAGRGMIWPLVGFSLIVTNFSGTQFLGLAGAGYDTGISVWNLSGWPPSCWYFLPSSSCPFICNPRSPRFPSS